MAVPKRKTSPSKRGMRRSHDEILRVIDRLGLSSHERVFAGSEGYLASRAQPRPSAAADHLIALARACPSEQPLN